MNRAHQKTLSAIFQSPVSPALEWRQIESLFKALGAKRVEGAGSRVRYELNGIIATFHRPHPPKEAKIYQIQDAKKFLERAGIEP